MNSKLHSLGSIKIASSKNMNCDNLTADYNIGDVDDLDDGDDDDNPC